MNFVQIKFQCDSYSPTGFLLTRGKKLISYKKNYAYQIKLLKETLILDENLIYLDNHISVWFQYFQTEYLINSKGYYLPCCHRRIKIEEI